MLSFLLSKGLQSSVKYISDITNVSTGPFLSDKHRYLLLPLYNRAITWVEILYKKILMFSQKFLGTWLHMLSGYSKFKTNLGLHIGKLI